MKKILLQYVYILSIAFMIFCLSVLINEVFACEKEQVKQNLPICEELQVSTEENPCKQEGVNIFAIGEALEKLGESGTLPK